MSSLRNALPRRVHKGRSQPQARRKFGILEKHKDYVVRAKAYHKKKQALQKLKEKAAFRNPDEFYFKMVKTITIDGVHSPESRLMKTQDMGYILQKVQSDKKKLNDSLQLHTLRIINHQRDVYYAEDRKTAASYRELEAKENRVNDLEIVHGYDLKKRITEKGLKVETA